MAIPTTGQYQETFERWRADPEGFWGEQAALVDWFATPASPRPQPRAVLSVVSGRADQHLLQRPRPTRDQRSGGAARPHLRQCRHRGEADADVCGTARACRGVRRRAAPARRRRRRPRGGLHADDPRGRDRDARLCTARGCALGCVRRVRGCRAGRAHRRRETGRDRFGVVRHRALARGAVQAAARPGARARRPPAVDGGRQAARARARRPGRRRATSTGTPWLAQAPPIRPRPCR